MGQLLDLGRQYGGLSHTLCAVGLGALEFAGKSAAVGFRDLGADNFALPDQATGKSGGAALL